MSKKIEISLDEINEYSRALHCPTRWRIIRLLADGNKPTKEIRNHLGEGCHSTGKQNLYYHLSELSSAGIIEMANYREEGGGAPEKVWELAVEQITVDLLKGELKDDCDN
ncbi:MAG: winged helix-turn-helix domain-containing protein [Candidatus Bipolaricaulota bacterium]|nr:winged helix-turn-helix transcriptional regulator [Candidatus Bipolaricaulota bacterium]MBS3791020.1 winged helix-turn-helix transcriptional regulator [Candidatus Bipolaricaulota bacterium]